MNLLVLFQHGLCARVGFICASDAESKSIMIDLKIKLIG
jgi:hypothetical protein